MNTGNSIISELTKAEIVKKVGHFGITIHYKDIKGIKHYYYYSTELEQFNKQIHVYVMIVLHQYFSIQ